MVHGSRNAPKHGSVGGLGGPAIASPIAPAAPAPAVYQLLRSGLRGVEVDAPLHAPRGRRHWVVGGRHCVGGWGEAGDCVVGRVSRPDEAGRVVFLCSDPRFLDEFTYRLPGFGNPGNRTRGIESS